MVTTAQRVLIAAPSDEARSSLARILGDDGLGVIAVADGGKALSETMVRKPDVLVLDLSLPLMSTSHLVKILRANPNTKTIPILFLGDAGQVVLEEEEGMSEVLRKPFLDEDVLARVRGMLARGRPPGAEGIAARDEGRRKGPEMAKQVVEIAEVRPEKAPDPGAASGKAGWMSPAYTVSREVRLDPKVLEENRCVAYNTESPQVEAYRVLRTRIMHRTRENGGTTVMVTSALAGEGKTVTAVNLALTFAKAYSQTALLVDADLKRQQVHRVLGFKSEKGLGNYLQEGCAVSDLVVWPGIEKLTILSGGKRIDGSSELLGSAAMKALVEDMKNRYPNRYVFFDVPPVLAGADTIVFAPLVDHILFVVRAGTSSLEDVRKALQMLPKEKILGLVLNRQPDADATRYYYY